MTSSRDRIEARRAIQERASARRHEQEVKERRIADLAVTVNVELQWAHRVMERAERAAGSALTTMIEDEGLSVTDAMDWIGDQTLTHREIGRLRALARNGAKDQTTGGAAR